MLDLVFTYKAMIFALKLKSGLPFISNENWRINMLSDLPQMFLYHALS